MKSHSFARSYAGFEGKVKTSLIGNTFFCAEFAIKIRQTFFFMNIQRVEKKLLRDAKGDKSEGVLIEFLLLLIQIAQNLIKRSILAALFNKFIKE